MENIIPDRITFQELHEIIQVLFSWENDHLHEFEVPGDRIYISDNDDTWANHYNESETLIDPFFRNYKWVRYTYDFGDNWRHRINIEKTDERYQLRKATLLKFKGDNFLEDSGGAWNEGSTRTAFDSAKVEQKLNCMMLSSHEELQEVKLLKESLHEMAKNLKKLFEVNPEILQSQIAVIRQDLYENSDPMSLKIEAWRKADQKGLESLSIKTPEKSQNMLLMDLGEKEDFLRIIYWHSRFNDFIDTIYQLDGTAYAASKELDAKKAILKIQDYAKELPYAEYSRGEIEHMANDLANRSDWLDVLYTTFYYRMNMHPYEAQDLLIQVVGAIMSGDMLNEIILNLQKNCSQTWSIGLSTEMWTVIAGIMLDLELPMLKGRSRIQYAEEMKCSPWSVGMAVESEQISNNKEKRMYQFPVEVQQWMYEAKEFGDESFINRLLNYKEQHQIYSEEYIYLLTESCITFGKTDIAEKLIRQLKRSSSSGKKEARELEIRLQQRYEVVDCDDDWFNDFAWNLPTNESVQQPYVRKEAKIGRNDPCPCGSGKKYKMCCGRN